MSETVAQHHDQEQEKRDAAGLQVMVTVTSEVEIRATSRDQPEKGSATSGFDELAACSRRAVLSLIRLLNYHLLRLALPTSSESNPSESNSLPLYILTQFVRS